MTHSNFFNFGETSMETGSRLSYLSQTTLQALALTTDELIESSERLIRGHSQARAWNAPKAIIQPPDGRYMMATLSAADDPPFLAMKSLIFNSKEETKNKPKISQK
jgi:hypothetical protein